MQVSINGPVHAQITNWATDGRIDVTAHDGDDVAVEVPGAAVSAYENPQTFHHVRDEQGRIVGALPVVSIQIRPVPRGADAPVGTVSLPHGSTASLATEGARFTSDQVGLRQFDVDQERPSAREARLAAEREARVAGRRPTPSAEPARAEPAESPAPAEPVAPADLSTAPSRTTSYADVGPVALDARNNTSDGALTVTTHDGNDVRVTAPEGANVFGLLAPQTYNLKYMLPEFRVTADPLPGSDQAVDVEVSLPRGSAARVSTTGGAIDVDSERLVGLQYGNPPGAVRAAQDSLARAPEPRQSRDPAPDGPTASPAQGPRPQRRNPRRP